MSGAEKFHGTTLISAEDGAVSSHRVTGMGRPGRPGPLVKWRSRSVCKGFHCPLSLAARGRVLLRHYILRCYCIMFSGIVKGMGPFLSAFSD